jgi:lysyl endopeptidase
MNLFSKTTVAAALALFLGCGISQAASPGVASVGSEAMKPSVDKRFSQRADAFLSAAPATFARTLPAVSTLEIQTAEKRVRPGIKALRVGVVRNLAEHGGTISLRSLKWARVANGEWVSKLNLSSTGALALRVELSGADAAIASGLSMRIAGSAAPSLIEGPLSLSSMRGATAWSHLTQGEGMQIEFALAGNADPRSLPVAIASVSHLDKDALNPTKLGACHRDVICEQSGGIESNASLSVARYIYNSGGSTFTCTGTLMNDNDTTTQIQHFLSAQHCLETAAEAATVTTLWYDQAASCGSGARDSRYQQVGGGADIQSIVAKQDMLLLKLRGTAPSTARLAGWDANAISGSPPMVVIHHPQGDYKKISRANFNGFAQWDFPGENTHISTLYTQGSTEQGSSGSSIRTYSGNDLVVRGTLSGGAASCTNTAADDKFGRLDLAQPIIDILAKTGTVNPPNPSSSVQSGWWYDENASGQGFGIEVVNGRLFVGGFLYDSAGAPVWFVSNGAMQTSTFYSGTINQFGGGQSLTGAYRAPFVLASPGTISFNFSSPTTAFMTWPGGQKNLKRFPIVPGGVESGAATGMPQRGWYFNAAENGRGYMIEVQGSTLFIAGFMYDDSGNPRWFSSFGQMSSTSAYSNSWLSFGFGQTFTSNYRQPTVTNSNVGFIGLNFTTPTTPILTLPTGRQVQLERFTSF